MPEHDQNELPDDNDFMTPSQLLFERVTAAAAHRVAQSAGVEMRESACDFAKGRLHVDLWFELGDDETT